MLLITTDMHRSMILAARSWIVLTDYRTAAEMDSEMKLAPGEKGRYRGVRMARMQDAPRAKAAAHGITPAAVPG